MTVMDKPRADKKLAPKVRWMIRADMPQVLDIENHSFEHPWAEEDFINVLRSRNCIGMVAELPNETIAGFMVYELCKNHLHVLDFAVEPSLREKGVGRTMIEKLLQKLSPDRRNRLVCEVRETNLLGCRFLRAMGFRAQVPLLHQFYDLTDEDAIRFVFRYKPCQGR